MPPWPDYIVIKVSALHPHPRKRRQLIKAIVDSPDYAEALVDAKKLKDDREVKSTKR